MKYIELCVISTATDLYLSHTSSCDLDQYGYAFYLTKLRLLETIFLLRVHQPPLPPPPPPPPPPQPKLLLLLFLLFFFWFIYFFFNTFFFLLMKLKCLCVITSVLGRVSDKGQGKIIILRINNVVYTSVLTLCFSLTESFHQLFIVLNTSTLKTSAKILGKYSFHGASQRTLRQLSNCRN